MKPTLLAVIACLGMASACTSPKSSERSGAALPGLSYAHSALEDSVEASWTAELPSEEAQAHSQWAQVVAAAGDVNDDGFNDLLVASPFYDADAGVDAGRVDLFLGSSEGVATEPYWTIYGEHRAEHLGAALGGGGDINNDGYSDIIIGSPGYSLPGTGGPSMGRVSVFLGSLDGPALTPSWSAHGTRAGDQFGFSVSNAGDINNDGYDDIIIGAPYYDLIEGTPSSEGRAYVYKGGVAGLSSSVYWSKIGSGPSTLFGYSVAGVGNVHGATENETAEDVLVGAPGDGSRIGAAYMFRGTDSGPASTAQWTLPDLIPACARAGIFVGPAGDMDGDGNNDVFVVCESSEPDANRDGRVVIFRGLSSGLAATPWWSVSGLQSGDNQIAVVALDYNDDDRRDVFIGAANRRDTLFEQGSLFGFIGTNDTPTVPPTFVRSGNSTRSFFGRSVAALGDFNGDGIDDIATGAPQTSSSEDLAEAGRAYVFYGDSSTPIRSCGIDADSDSDGDGLSNACDPCPDSVVNYQNGDDLCSDTCSGVLDVEHNPDADTFCDDSDICPESSSRAGLVRLKFSALLCDTWDFTFKLRGSAIGSATLEGPSCTSCSGSGTSELVEKEFDVDDADLSAWLGDGSDTVSVTGNTTSGTIAWIRANLIYNDAGESDSVCLWDTDTLISEAHACDNASICADVEVPESVSTSSALQVLPSVQADNDRDGVGDACDTCDTDGSGQACTCEQDAAFDNDGDGICAAIDNCPDVSNVTQADGDGDDIGNECDNCVAVSNADQADQNHDDQGDACDDSDGDSVMDATDNCPNLNTSNHSNVSEITNSSVADAFGDACDTCLLTNRDMTIRSLRFEWLASTCSNSANAYTFSLNDTQVGTATAAVQCDCVAEVQTFTVPYADLQDHWIGNGTDSASFEFSGTGGYLAWMRAVADFDIESVSFCLYSTDNGECAAINTCDLPVCPGDNCAADGEDILVASERNRDFDDDGFGDGCDNCPSHFNSNQADSDSDGFGNICDNCPALSNSDQSDLDNDGVGDACDNCILTPNDTQANSDSDAFGDLCDPDADDDGIPNNNDNCPVLHNITQADRDNDGVGDACDDAPGYVSADAQRDQDGDSIIDSVDNCPFIVNADQSNLDRDSFGDACDSDDDGDGIPDTSDGCTFEKCFGADPGTQHDVTLFPAAIDDGKGVCAAGAMPGFAWLLGSVWAWGRRRKYLKISRGRF